MSKPTREFIERYVDISKRAIAADHSENSDHVIVALADDLTELLALLRDCDERIQTWPTELWERRRAMLAKYKIMGAS